jgi:hypothetical protein
LIKNEKLYQKHRRIGGEKEDKAKKKKTKSLFHFPPSPSLLGLCLVFCVAFVLNTSQDKLREDNTTTQHNTILD